MIEVTSVIKSLFLHLVGVLMVEFGSSMSYLVYCAPCLCGKK